MTWFCLRTFESPAFLTKHLSAFQEMLRARSRRSYDAFWVGMDRASRACRSETREIFAFFLHSASQLGAPAFGARHSTPKSPPIISNKSGPELKAKYNL
jgi:hypothetical protein